MPRSTCGVIPSRHILMTIFGVADRVMPNIARNLLARATCWLPKIGGLELLAGLFLMKPGKLAEATAAKILPLSEIVVCGHGVPVDQIVSQRLTDRAGAQGAIKVWQTGPEGPPRPGRWPRSWDQASTHLIPAQSPEPSAPAPPPGSGVRWRSPTGDR